MCIICAKPQGAKLPTEETLRAMFTHNPHGAGFMYARNGRVEIRKGFMTYADFTQALRHTLDVIGEDASLVMHFRITTHGGTCPENTHPFPMTADIAEMRRTSSSARVGVAHNGIIRTVTPRTADVSDTMEFIASVLTPVARKNPSWYNVPRTVRNIEKCINGSRLAVMLASGEIVRIGTWIEHDGCWYSNDSYETVDKRWVVAPQTDTSCKSAYSLRLPWERDARIYAYLMPLGSRDTIEDERGDKLSGDWFAIDKSRRVYAIDIDECIAYLTDAHLLTHTRYDRAKTVLFEVA